MALKLEKSSSNYKIRIISILFCIFIMLLFSACLQKPLQVPSPSSKASVSPSDVNSHSLKPGLSVYYLIGFWRHAENMPKPETFVKNGKPGKPISRIDHRFGYGEVFDSGRNRGVGVQMTGFIHLPKAGEWQFKVQSNDGIFVYIKEILVVSDPKWHSDRFSDPIGFQAKKPGWYKILLRYFQRKGTATLEFYWKPPGEEKFTIIPNKAYWHIPG